MVSKATAPVAKRAKMVRSEVSSPSKFQLSSTQVSFKKKENPNSLLGNDPQPSQLPAYLESIASQIQDADREAEISTDISTLFWQNALKLRNPHKLFSKLARQP
jgi:hypothetical protein